MLSIDEFSVAAAGGFDSAITQQRGCPVVTDHPVVRCHGAGFIARSPLLKRLPLQL